MDAHGYMALCYALAVFLVVAMAGYAFVMGFIMRRKIADTEAFITARGQVGALRIGWSFFAGAVGAWVIASPANYATYSGLLGLFFYSFCSGLPFLMIAYAGDIVREKVPHVLSLTDFIGWRFGFVAKTFVVLLVLFNMSIALLAEFTTIGSIFQSYVGSQPYPMIIVVGVLTLAYTAYGGLLVSIFTDTVQGIASVLFFGVLAIYVAATFRPESLPKPLPCSPEYYASTYYCISGTPSCSAFDSFNEAALAADPNAFPVDCPIFGWSSIFVMPASLFTATIFSEAMWQRVWASKDKRSLRVGAAFGAAAVIVVVFFAGLCGLLAAWAGLIVADDPTTDAVEATNGNLYLFQVLHGGKMPSSTTVSNWIGVWCVVLAAVMNEGAVDSIQNGMAAGITSYVAPMLKWWNLTMTRLVVVVLNAGLIGIAIWLVLGTVKVTVLELFLLTNMLCSTSALPVLFGLSDRLHRHYGGGSFLASCLFSIFCTCVYGVNYYYNTFPDGWEDTFYGHTYTAGSFASGMFYTWIGNGYRWQFFMVPIGVSIGSVFLCAAFNYLLQRFAKQPAVPGFTAAATHPALFPNAPGPPSVEGSDELAEKKVNDSPPAKAAALPENGARVEAETVATQA